MANSVVNKRCLKRVARTMGVDHTVDRVTCPPTFWKKFAWFCRRYIWWTFSLVMCHVRNSCCNQCL